jgi:hypothetical protein
MSDLAQTTATARDDSDELLGITEVAGSRYPEAGASCTGAPPAAPDFAISEVASSQYPEAGASCQTA